MMKHSRPVFTMKLSLWGYQVQTRPLVTGSASGEKLMAGDIAEAEHRWVDRRPERREGLSSDFALSFFKILLLFYFSSIFGYAPFH